MKFIIETVDHIRTKNAASDVPEFCEAVKLLQVGQSFVASNSSAFRLAVYFGQMYLGFDLARNKLPDGNFRITRTR